MRKKLFLIIAAVCAPLITKAFFVPALSNRRMIATFRTQHPPSGSPFRLHESLEEQKVVNGIDEVLTKVQESYPDAEILSVTLEDHRPLGCTVEESLDTKNDQSVVFVSKIVEGGNAEKAGIQVGDVLVGVTGLFGEITPAWKVGVDKIKGFVSSVGNDSVLELRLARGSDVLERHEKSIVDLCQTPGASDREVDDCMANFIAAGYDYEVIADGDEDEVECMEDDDTECILDNMMNIWAEELPPPPTTSGITDTSGETSATKPKPWSSRSSPSGTFVRDPVTGDMRNIDA